MFDVHRIIFNDAWSLFYPLITLLTEFLHFIFYFTIYNVLTIIIYNIIILTYIP